MNQISNNPGPKDFGHEFNYEAWTPNNIFTLCNVPWNNDYRDVHSYRTHDELNSYINSLESPLVEIKHATRAKINMPIRLGMTLAKAMKYNYIRVSNGLQPVVSGDEIQHYYYFIVGIREVNPEVTEIIVQLDVWSTFMPTIEGVRGYVERGHVGVANTRQMENYGRDFLAIPEGFDLGTDYRNVAVRREKIMEPGIPDSSSVGDYNVIGVFATNPGAKPTTEDGKANYTTAKGGYFQGIASGATVYLWENIARFRDFMVQHSIHPWLTSGLLTAMLIPNITRYHPGFSWLDTNIQDPATGFLRTGKEGPSETPNMLGHLMFNNWRESQEILNQIPARYRHLRKLFTFPYMAIEMTTWSATPIILKPQNWADANATITERASLMPPGARVQFSPQRYNAIPGYASPGEVPFDDGGEYFDLFTQISNFPTVPIVNDGAILALAGQQNSIAFSQQSADWSQQRALTAAQTGYDQSMSGIGVANAMTEAANQNAGNQLAIQQQLARDNQLMNAIGGGAMSGAAGLAAGPVGGAVGLLGGAGSGILGALTLNNAQQAANDSLAGTVSNNWRTTGIGNDQTAYLADSNRSLAQYAARGDYENTMAGINAKVRDLEMTPASISGQMGGELINMVNDLMEVSLKWKMIDNAAMKIVGEHWLRYGYAVRQYTKLPASLKVMDTFTYWKMSETYLSGAFIPELYKQALRGIFEKGVTIWDDPSYIGRMDYDIADNNPLENVSL